MSEGETPGAAGLGSTPTGDVGELAPHRSVRQVIDEWQPRLAAILAEWQASLPPDAAETWTPGAAYIRESSAASLARDAPDVQLRNVLALLAQKRIFVASDALFFDVQSATDIATRAAFQSLFEMAIRGGFKAIGVFVNERLFRNLAQAIQIKRQFRLKGIELVYLGRYEGDQRNPAAWHFETMQDAAAELHARNTGYYIGTHFEVISRQGRPVGGIHEVFRQGRRAPSFLGRRGSVLSWSLVEPLASILKEGKDRYLAGATFAELGVWSATTMLRGLTPKGRVMDSAWWRNSLQNPTLAGYQVPTTYMGFKPGKESPPRPMRTANSELVPSLLPPLWSLEDYRQVLSTGRERFHAPKRRRGYRSYLLQGIAYDADCGHRLRIQQHRDDGRYWMACGSVGAAPRHSPGRRADVAERELDEIISSLSFDDQGLHDAIEDELRRLADVQSAAVSRFRPDPAIGAARRALAALDKTGMNDVTATLESRILELEAADEERRDSLVQPVVDYRAALAHLRNWDAVWAEADVELKNRLLRDAGLRVKIGNPPNGTKGPARILAISAEDAVFSLALAAALKDRSVTSHQEDSCNRTNVIPLTAAVRVAIQPELLAIAQRLLPHAVDDGAVLTPRPVVAMPRSPHRDPPDRPDGWLTIREYALKVGRARSTIHHLVHAGRLESRIAHRGGIRWRLIRMDGQVADEAA
jgi:hypothetical protein